ncbi:hypothetical protein [Mycoplasmopsis synoviae]|uniref:hypothetical protein n=1 Tax=Mycoplasmopsis synoviae TaxID=2109 RepID=UPI0034DAC49E
MTQKNKELKPKKSQQDLSQETNFELLREITEKQQIILKKHRVSYGVWVFLNFLSVFITSVIIILNLYAIRYNPRPDETMSFFVAIAILSATITFLVSIRTFFAISDKKEKLNYIIAENQNYIEQLKKSIKRKKNKTSGESEENQNNTIEIKFNLDK